MLLEVYMTHRPILLKLKRLEVFYALAYCELFHIGSFVVRKLYMFKKNTDFH